MTVRELLAKTDSRELSEWLVYYKIKDDPATEPQSQEAVISQMKAVFGG